MKRLSIAPVAVLASLSLAGCGMESGRPQAGFEAALPPAPPVYAPENGAIFQASHGYAALYEGTRARRVGDLVTVVLVENVNSIKATNASTSRDGNAGIDLPSTGPFALLAPSDLNFSADASFNGQGRATQRSSINGTIAVTVAEVRPNGTALVVGERHMQLSQGNEWVQFSGIIRLADIDADNRIISSRIADAQIVYGGRGAVQQASRPGWLSRFFNIISPF